jgi:protease-4
VGCIACLLALLTVPACEGRPTTTTSSKPDAPSTPSEPHLAELDLRRGVPELPATSMFGDASPRSFAHLVLRLREMRDEEKLRGVFVRIGAAGMGLARAEELGRSLAHFREAKLPVVCHADGYNNSTMMMAARGCDQIWISPAGNVETVGIGAQLLFGRSLLDRMDVSVDFLQVGKFKGASETFTRDSASEEARTSLRTALTGIRSAWLDAIEKGRGAKHEGLGIEDGPHTAEAAVELGLVDHIGVERDARKAATDKLGLTNRVSYFGGRSEDSGGMADVVRILSGSGGAVAPHIAVLRATGAITLNANRSPFSSGGIAERRLSRTLRRLREDDNVEAVVLRIDSPGGSALASDLLWAELMALRAEKPLVVSVGGMAASGGYYMACAATRVVAERSSIIGSIGVVAGKLSFERTLQKIGVHVESVPAKEDSGSRALYASALAAWDEPTRAKVLAAIQRTYELFIERIAQGRDLAAADIAPSAEGRIMAGTDAKKGKLIDEIGGLDRSIALARELAELPEDVTVLVVQPPSGLLGLLGADDAESRARAQLAFEREARRQAAGAMSDALAPFRAETDAFAASMAPLLQGERILAALPFALALR